MKIKTKKETLIGYLFILPTLIGFCCFMLYPLLYSLFLSFWKWNMFRGIKGSKFIGMDNYKQILNNEYFLTGVVNNFKLAVIAVPLLIFTSLIIASLLNQKIFCRGIFRTIYFLPYITTVTAAAVVFGAVLNVEMGPVNEFLRVIGIDNPPAWLSSSKWALPTVAIFWFWRNIGFCVIVYLAGLQNIPKSYYEAAEIDGAGAVSKFFNITMPSVSPVTFFLLIWSVISAFQVFAEVNILTRGGPGTSTYTLVYHIYHEAFVSYNLGYASAVAIVFFLIILVVTLIQWVGQKKWVNY